MAEAIPPNFNTMSQQQIANYLKNQANRNALINPLGIQAPAAPLPLIRAHAAAPHLGGRRGKKTRRGGKKSRHHLKKSRRQK